MTTIKRRLSGKIAIRSLILLTVLFLSSNAISQLDSAAVTGVSFSQEVITDSATNVSDTIDVMNVDVYTNDVDFLGELIVTVYEAGTMFPLAKRKITKQQAVDLSLITGDNVLVSLDNLTESESYQIEVSVRNYQGANLPLVVYNHN